MNFKFQISNFKFAWLLIFEFLILNFISAGTASAELTAKANHDHITIDFFYHGSTVSVKGIAEPGTDLIVKITSPERHEALRKKGKVAGFLWMNVGKLTFERAPFLYFLHSTKKVEDILSREEMDKYVLGYPALSRHMEVTPVANDKEKNIWFNEFLKYKESSSLYSTSSGKISTVTKNGKQEYFIVLPWPYQASPDNYMVTVYAVKDGKVVETAEAKVLVEQVGMVKGLADMAKDKAVFYGIISVIAALGAGFGVGLVFRKGGGAH
ncbi:MAG: TIGR02186 family protein [Nitrospirae bacterium]|nr:TIGR02186 family protein [Nitrospirota bacterium]